MIARWKGRVEAGSTSEHISAFWDVFPTLAALTNSAPPQETDGISFLPTLLGQPDQEQHEYLYWEFHEKGGRIAIRKGKWKAVKYNVLKEPDAPLELYDLSADMGETQNIASSHAEVVAEMEEILASARTSSEVFTFGERGYLQKE